MSAKSTTYHACLSVRGALMNWSAARLSKLFAHDDGRPMSADEAKAVLLDALAQGHEVLPFGEPCEGFDYRGAGCPGHVKESPTP